MFKKSIALAVPALAATALIAASLSGGAVSAKSGDGKAAPPPHAKAAKAATLTSCTGGAQKHSWDRGVVGSDVYTYDNTSAIGIPGSLIHVPGPAKGLDVVSVNFSTGIYLDSGAYGQIKVLKNGVPMQPSDNIYGSFHYQNGYGTFSRNYCGKVGKAGATIRVVLDAYDSDGTPGDYVQLFDPMVHVEHSE